MTEEQFGQMWAIHARSEGHGPGLPEMYDRPPRQKYGHRREEVLRALTDEWQSTDELIQRTGSTRNGVQSHLRDLVMFGEAEKTHKMRPNTLGVMRPTNFWRRARAEHSNRGLMR